MQDIQAMIATLTVGFDQLTDPSEQIHRDRNHENLGRKFKEKNEQYIFDWKLNLSSSVSDLDSYKLEWRFDYEENLIVFKLILGNNSKFVFGSDLFLLGFSEGKSSSLASSSNLYFTSSHFCILWYDLAHNLHAQEAFSDAEGKLELVFNEKVQPFCHHLIVKKHFESRSVGKKVSRENNRIVRSEDERQVFKSLKLDDNVDKGAEDEIIALLELIKKRRKLEIKDKQSDEKQIRRHTENKQSLEFIIARPLDSCRQGVDRGYVIDNGTTHLLWAHLSGPMLKLDGCDLIEELSKPSSKFGMHRVQLLATKSGEAIVSDQQNTARDTVINDDFLQVNNVADHKVTHKKHRHELRMKNFSVPSDETTYACRLLKLPSNFHKHKHHIISYEPVIDSKNSHVVHHMELFNCILLDDKHSSDLEDALKSDTEAGWLGTCESSSRPYAMRTCKRVVLAWAMGAKPLIYPQNVGQSIGGLDYSPYMMLEVHYNNEKRVPNLIDSSGLQFEYTRHLRKYDAGVIEIGLSYNDKNSIPPQAVVPLSGHCVAECTRVGLRHLQGNKPEALFNKSGHDSDDNGIHIFAAQMHTHLTGVSSWTEHIRGGKLVAELQRDDHYSPHFQEIRLLPRPLSHVLPGDALVHYCLYNTSDRVNITLGGFGTRDEMCISYLHYYPKVELEVCKSSIDDDALKQYFEYMAKKELQSTGKDENKSISEKYKSIQWTPKRTDQLLELYQKAPVSIECLKSNGKQFVGPWNGLEATQVLHRRSNNFELVDTFMPIGSDDKQSVVKYRGINYRRRHSSCKVGL